MRRRRPGSAKVRGSFLEGCWTGTVFFGDTRLWRQLARNFANHRLDRFRPADCELYCMAVSAVNGGAEAHEEELRKAASQQSRFRRQCG